MKLGQRLAVAVFLDVDLAVTPDPETEVGRKCVDDRDPDSVQAARDLVGVLIELSPPRAARS